MLWTLLVVNLAVADVPPPRGYVEQCTVEKQAAPGKECVSCAGYHGGREPCEALEAQGYTKACQTNGASVWTEVMCKAAPAGSAAPTEPVATPTDPAPKSDSGCASVGFLLAGPWWLAPLLWRRRWR
jgi:hypothetical protein